MSLTVVGSKLPHIRNSERRDFKRCQQRWQWAWRQGLKPVYEKPGALWFGIGMHLALQERYKYPGLRRGSNVLKVWRDYVGDTEAVIYGDNYTEDKEDFYDAGELGEIMLGGYLDHYGKDERWYVISAEQTFDLEIPHPVTRDPMAILNGTFDLVCRDQEANDSLWIWDHKNLASIQTAHLTLDDQMGTYWAVAGDVLAARNIIEPGEKLDGILYNILRKAKPDDRPKNADGLATNKPQRVHYFNALQEAGASVTGTVNELRERCEKLGLTVLGEVSKRQPDALFHRELIWRTAAERRTQIRRIQQEALQMQALRDRTFLPTKNPTKDCSHDCPFFQMCELHEAGDDWQAFRDSTFTRVDPYADHREGRSRR